MRKVGKLPLLWCGKRNFELSSCAGYDQKVCNFERNLQDPLCSSKGGEECPDMTQLPASFPCLRKKNVKLSSRKLWLNVILFLQLISEERDMEWKVTHFGFTANTNAQILEKSKHVLDECFGTFLCPMIGHTLHI
jgi:hypothetical protein